MSGGVGASDADGVVPAAKLLIAAQVALSVVLLTGAALLVRSLRSLETQPTGLDRDHLLIADLDIGSRGYSGRSAEYSRRRSWRGDFREFPVSLA